jgi:hypothetical protein
LGRLASASEVAGGHAKKCFKIGRPYALFKMVRYVLLRPLRLEQDVSWSNILVLPFYLLLLFDFSWARSTLAFGHLGSLALEHLGKCNKNYKNLESANFLIPILNSNFLKIKLSLSPQFHVISVGLYQYISDLFL